MCRQAQAGLETGRPQGRGTHAWQRQVYLGTGAGRPVGEEVLAVAGRPASQPRPRSQGGQLGGLASHLYASSPSWSSST